MLRNANQAVGATAMYAQPVSDFVDCCKKKKELRTVALLPRYFD